MKKKRILAMILAVASCLSLAVSASAASTARKATDFRDFDKSAWYAEAVSAAVDNGLLYGKSATIIDPNDDMTRAEMAAIINRSFGCYVKADIFKYKDVSKDKWYFEDVAMAVQMGTYNGRSNTAMAPDAPITRQEAMTVVARALELDYDAYAKTDLSAFSDRSEISNWALPYVRAMVGADYIHGRGKILAPQDDITRAEFVQIFHNIIGTYITAKGSYDKDIKGSVLIRTDEVTLQNMTVVCNEEGKLEGLPLNRALRDEDGDIYDVVAGTFMVVGLTDDSFGSLTVEQMQKFSDHFKVPEQFVKLGDKIVAIPMISKEQQKQESIEQKDFEMNADTSGLTVAGHIGTWHTIDQHEVDGHSFYLMEHDA